MSEASGGDLLTVTARIAERLDGLQVPYAIVGSLASSLHGVPRSTHDADVVAALEERHIEPLVAALAGAFYVDAERVRRAVCAGRSFNVIHLPTMLKVDVFVVGDDRFARSELARRESIELGEYRTSLWFATAEDALLHKLYWYRLGRENSERQWNDVLGVLRVQGDSLDRPYLERWADELGVADLLERARRAAG